MQQSDGSTFLNADTGAAGVRIRQSNNDIALFSSSNIIFYKDLAINNSCGLYLSEASLTTYESGSASPSKRIYQTIANSDYWSIYGEGTTNNGALILEVGDDLTESIRFRYKKTYSPYNTYTPYNFFTDRTIISGARVQINYDALIDTNTDYSENCLEVATSTDNGSHSYKPGIGFHSKGQYASLFYLNAQTDWKAKDDIGNIITFYHTGNLPSVLNNYLPLSGGTMTGNISFVNSTTGTGKGIYGTNGDNDHWRIVGGATSTNFGYLEIATDDDQTEPIYIRQYQGTFTSPSSIKTLTLLDQNGNTLIPQTVSSTNYYNAGSYYVSNYAAGGSPAIITNQGLANFYTLKLDYYSTGERSLNFADCAYLGPTYESFFNNGSTQNNAIVVKGAGNKDYAGIYFGVSSINSRYIGTKGDNTLYISGPNIKTDGILTQTGTSTFVGDTNIGRVAWIDYYTSTIYDKLYVSGTSYFSDMTVNGIINQDNGNINFGSVDNTYDFTVRNSSYFLGSSYFTDSTIIKARYGILATTATTTIDDTLDYQIIRIVGGTPSIILSDSTTNGYIKYVYNRSGSSITVQSSVSGGLEYSGSPYVSSISLGNNQALICIKMTSGSNNGGWMVRAL